MIEDGGLFKVNDGTVTIADYAAVGWGVSGEFEQSGGTVTVVGEFYTDIGCTVDIDAGTLTLNSNWYDNGVGDWAYGILELSGGTIDLAGEFSFEYTDVTATLNGTNLQIGGDFDINGSDWTISAGSFTFDGTSTQTIFGEGAIVFNDVVVDNANGVTLGHSITGAGTLTLNSGLLTTSASNLLSLGSSATISGGSATSFVNGPMSNAWPSSGSSTKTFPLGKGSTYRPLEISLQTSSDQVVRAEVLNGDAGGTPEGGLDAISTVRYHETSITSGSIGNVATAKITFGSDDGVQTPANLVVARSTTQTGTYNSLGQSAYDASSVTSATYDPTEAGDFLLLGSIADNSLPVTLTTFSAVVEDNGVLLRWVTESEINNQAFILERSDDSQTFEQIAELPGQGNCSHRSEYEYRDARIAGGQTWYYRLSDRDFNGHITVHNIISVKTPEKEVCLFK